jgi:hypothetical protein
MMMRSAGTVCVLSALLVTAACTTDVAPESKTSGDPETIAESANELVTYDLAYSANGYFPNEHLCNAASTAIKVRAPDAAGPYPVLIYNPGTGERHDDVLGMAIINEAARQGFFAASIAYSNATLPAFCGAGLGWHKARCAYSTSVASSATNVICSHPKANCAAGIVTVGFSQGGALAALARNFDVRVRGAWTMGFANRTWTGGHEPCFEQGTGGFGTNASRVLKNNRLVVFRGGHEQIAGAPIPAAWLNQTTGRTCTDATIDCRHSTEGWGWYRVTDGELDSQYNANQHCFQLAADLFFGVKIDCPGTNLNRRIDPKWGALPPALTYPSGVYKNVKWLKDKILPLGQQI